MFPCIGVLPTCDLPSGIAGEHRHPPRQMHISSCIGVLPTCDLPSGIAGDTQASSEADAYLVQSMEQKIQIVKILI